jgi:hypothetical protein
MSKGQQEGRSDVEVAQDDVATTGMERLCDLLSIESVFLLTFNAIEHQLTS